MTNQLIVVTVIAPNLPPEKRAIAVRNIFQIRPVYSNIPAIPATPGASGVSYPSMTAARGPSGNILPPDVPTVRDSFGNAVHDDSNTLMPSVPGSRDAAGNIVPPVRDQTNRDADGNVAPRDQ